MTKFREVAESWDFTELIYFIGHELIFKVNDVEYSGIIFDIDYEYFYIILTNSNKLNIRIMDNTIEVPTVVEFFNRPLCKLVCFTR